ncbi:Pal1 cell morphology protein-domain-containing protein [Crassisporium funariophilum]|nr:Pal1 cell morphology protein-domain-containing protein [Crassisporium funariophilum]
MPAAVPKNAPLASNRDHDITEAVRDTVTVRGQQDNSARAKMNRSQTGVVPAGGISSSRPSGRRSHSEDSANIVEKPRASGKSRSKKGSQHADVIDRLDFTGVGPMFHHDGPFDACAPSRNKHHSKAPMYAWGRNEEPTAQRYGDSAYPAASAYKAFSNDYPEPPKKKVDAIAEAWGIHEPEPFEEFFAGGGTGKQSDTPASSIYNGKDSHNSHSTSRSGPAVTAVRRSKDTRDPRDERDVRPRMAARRSLVPPPQPIFADPSEIELPESPPASSPGFPKRSKSLMHRIRKMRDAPNVPVAPDYEQPPSPTSPVEPTYPNSNGTRPTHRPQNSFLGRFGGAASRAQQNQLNEKADKPEPYVFIETTQNNKDLPLPPAMTPAATIPGDTNNTSSQGYFEGQASSSPGQGLGRKTSLMKKVGRAVRGAK